MEITQLLYLQDMAILDCSACILDVLQGEPCVVILDRTVFYPQGGGQPSDKGIIRSPHASFEVQKVVVENGIALHYGIFTQGVFSQQEVVDMQVSPAIRNLHNKNHSAGHLIDYALLSLGYSLISGKGYHFPQGPYVQYQGTLEQNEREALLPRLEDTVNVIASRSLPISVSLQENDPERRIMTVQGYAPILCGGTHVINTQDIGHITIRKIKNEKGYLRVSYSVP